MLKKITLILTVCLLLICTACSSTSYNDNETIQVVIPASLLELTGSDPERTTEGYQERFQNAELVDGDIFIEATQQQLDDEIQSNNEFILEIIEELTDYNPNYKCEVAEDYNKIIYQFDENISISVSNKLLLGVTSMCALNGIFSGHGSDWSIYIVIKNYHTGNIVSEGTFPHDDLSFGSDEWEASYNE